MMIGQPLFSIPICPQPLKGLHPTLILSFLIYYLPISFSVCLSFSLLVPCAVGSSLQVLLILLCAHIISICVFSVVIRSSYNPITCLIVFKGDRTTSFLHSSLSSAFQRASPNPNPVHSDILSSHLFFCLISFSLQYFSKCHVKNRGLLTIVK